MIDPYVADTADLYPHIDLDVYLVEVMEFKEAI